MMTNTKHPARRTLRPALWLGAIALLLSACGADLSKHTTLTDQYDLLIYGGVIYTGLEEPAKVEAVAVAGNTIVAMGKRSELTQIATGNTNAVNLRGATLFAGFVDAHVHLRDIGLRELELNLEGTPSIEALRETVAASVAELEDGEVLIGRGWIETDWPEKRAPTRQDIDAVSPNNPVLLTRADHHAILANTAALKRANISGATPAPEGGRIELGPDAAPTGILVDAAMALVRDLVPSLTQARKRAAYQTASDTYVAQGWTGVHNMSVAPRDVSLIESMSANNDIELRVYNALEPSGLRSLVQSGARFTRNGKVITRAVKLYVDGALGSRGAALFSPYSDDPRNSGLLLMQENAAKARLLQALRNNIQVNTHAIGDKGNNLVLNWYEDIFSKNPEYADMRWRIEHAQILQRSDIDRFAQLDVIASMQPSHAIGDLFFAPDRLGAERLGGAYAWRSLIDSGAIIAGGSDAPVERGDPRIEFYAAVARKSLDGFANKDWNRKEAVTREEALKMFTLWPAYASFQEDTLGTIEIGKRADFTGFSKDLMKISEKDILKAKPVLTIINGEIVFDETR